MKTRLLPLGHRLQAWAIGCKLHGHELLGNFPAPARGDDGG